MASTALSLSRTTYLSSKVHSKKNGGNIPSDGSLFLGSKVSLLPLPNQSMDHLKKKLCVVAYAESSPRDPRPENVAGDLFVDHTCIDCDTCRWMAPDVFSRIGDMSAVYHQPENEVQKLQALQALLACPTASIHTRKSAADMIIAQDSFPIPIDEANLPGVYHCGYHSRKSYGATSYFIRRSEGNILVDSPRYDEKLASKLDAMGGVQYMFLTHRDDVADHHRWHLRFRCQRVLHVNEMTAGTCEVEMRLHGTGPWCLGSDVDIIHTPGHTDGSVSLHLKSMHVLFSGDHLCYSHRQKSLSIMKHVNWHSVPLQISSVKKLLSLDFVWLLPGHGRRFKFDDIAHKNRDLEKLIAREEESLSAH